MRPFKFLLLALVFGGAVTSAHGQLVHLTFSDLNKPLLWQSDSDLVPWHMSTGKLRYFEIYYDPATATVTPGEPGRPESYPDYIYTFSDPTRNFWRFQVTGPEEGTSFTVTRPLVALYHYISSDDLSQRLERSYENDDGAFYLKVPFHGSVSVPPVPPFIFGTVSLDHLVGYPGWFDIPHMGRGSVFEGEFASARAAIVPYVGFTPVPEASTYAIGGVAVLALGILSRRLRRNRAAA